MEEEEEDDDSDDDVCEMDAKAGTFASAETDGFVAVFDEDDGFDDSLEEDDGLELSCATASLLSRRVASFPESVGAIF